MDELTSRDPEPEEGLVVTDRFGRQWGRDDGPYGGPGKANWVLEAVEFPSFVHESWIKVAGNYGPVTLVS